MRNNKYHVVLLHYDLHSFTSILEDKIMTFDDLHMNNEAWEYETLIIIVDVATTYEMEAFNADIKFQNRIAASFNRNVVLLA